MVRDAGLRLEQTDLDVKRMFARADAWRDCPVPRNRLLAVNQMALAFYQAQFPDSWGRDYLRDRMGQDLTGDPRFRPGHAPAGWTRLVDHLHRHGVTDEEMLAAGVATTARTGRLIDRFRDRLIFPITNHDGEVLGFVGRRHPDAADTALAGPKYLNTAETPLYHKGAQLFGAPEPHRPVRSRSSSKDPSTPSPSPSPAPAATSGWHRSAPPSPTNKPPNSPTTAPIRSSPPTPTSPARSPPNAPSGTSPPTASTPATPPGPTAPTPPTSSPTTDPQASPLPSTGPAARATPWSTNASATSPPDKPATEAIQIIAAQPPTQWDTASDRIADQLGTPIEQIRRDLLTAVQAWNTDPQGRGPTPA